MSGRIECLTNQLKIQLISLQTMYFLTFQVLLVVLGASIHTFDLGDWVMAVHDEQFPQKGRALFTHL